MELDELIIHIKNDELDYFDEFYEKTKRQVYYFIYSIVKNSMDTEDLLQDTYLKLLKYKKRIKPDSVLVYLLQIAKTLSYNFIKKQKRIEIVEVDDYIDNNNNIKLNQMINEIKQILTDIEFQVVILHVIDELKHKEIAQILKKPLGTITWIYNEAIKKLRRDFND